MSYSSVRSGFFRLCHLAGLYQSLNAVANRAGKVLGFIAHMSHHVLRIGGVTELSREASEMFQCITYEDKREVYGFKIHSLSTFDKVKKYYEGKHSESAEKPYFIEVGDTERTINLYAIASIKFQIAV